MSILGTRGRVAAAVAPALALKLRSTLTLILPGKVRHLAGGREGYGRWLELIMIELVPLPAGGLGQPLIGVGEGLPPLVQQYIK
jgi:hypothetical protein